MAENRTALIIARNRLLKIWFIGSALPIVVLIVQTILGTKYEGIEEQVWGWFSPLIFPTITLMLGVIGAGALTPGESADKTVNNFFLKITTWVSIIYLFIVALVILLEPMSAQPSIKVFTKSNLFITPVQGLATAALGFLFSTTRTEPKKEQLG
ncbi:MAG TPA: hypothetical protein VD993_07235 [Chitinophagaceae bacterium]|nr:hypothetical protein [Chitinophagaceae bacterium]